MELEWGGLWGKSLSCAQLGAMTSMLTMPTQGTALGPQHGAGMGAFHLESFKAAVWHQWLHLQFKLVYFLLFSFYSTEFSACERCSIVISGGWASPFPTLTLLVSLMLKKYLLEVRIMFNFHVAVTVLMSSSVWKNLREIWAYPHYGVAANKCQWLSPCKMIGFKCSALNNCF